ncbi:hypothetical protein NN561_012694 [Cricetulus griseus]
MAPVIVVAPGNRSVVAGSSETTLECIANARPVEELSLYWKRNGVRLTSGLHSFGRRLTISNPTSADTGLYVCEATLRGSTFEPARAKAFLSIIEPPYFTAEPESRILGEVEESVDIPCRAMGNLILASGSVRIPRFMLLESGGLRIAPVFIQDAGNYTCYAANTEASVNASAMLTVWNRTSIVHPPEDRVVIKGTTATLCCGATHDPRTTLRLLTPFSFFRTC